VWRSRIWRSSGTSAFSCWVVLLLLSASALSIRVEAAGTCSQVRLSYRGYTSAWGTDPSAEMQGFVAYCGASTANANTCLGGTVDCVSAYTCTFSGGSASVSAWPTSITGTWHHKEVSKSTGAVLEDTDATTTSFASQSNPDGCPVCPAAGTWVNIIGDPASTTPGTSACVDGCSVQYEGDGTNVTGGPGDKGIWGFRATGQACGQSAGSALPDRSSSNQDCTVSSASGTLYCNEGPQGHNCGTFNGDLVCVDTISPGTCVSYASGGAACVAAAGSGPPATPPAPNSGSPGTVATASGAVSTSSQSVYYYSASTVASSTTQTQTTSPIQPQPIGSQGLVAGGGSSSSSSSGGSSSSGSGDCAADGSNCSPGLPSNSWANDCTSTTTCFEGFYTAVQAAPILQGASAIESAWPAGSCDIGSVQLATFGGASFNYGSTACQVFSQYIAPPLSAIMLAVWAVLGVMIILTA
jgi:hypothetical protein